jgi:hypothetical protein
MFNLKHKLPIWAMGVLVIVGTIDEWFLWDPEHGKALITGQSLNIPGVVMLGVPILIGWLYLMFGKDQLEPRLHWFWTPFGLLMVLWAWSTFYGGHILEDGRAITTNTLLAAGPEFWRSTAIGLLFAFYALGSAKPLWYFYWGWFLGAVTMYPGEILRLLGFIEIPWSPYLRPEEAGMFWHYWGNFFLDAYIVPLGLVAGYFIIRWRRSVLEKEGERHPGFWGFWEGIGLPFVLLGRALKRRRLFRK